MAQPVLAWVDQGDRSHPHLMQLDGLKITLSYPGWEFDFRDAEAKHLAAPNTFNDGLFKLLEKQRMYSGNRTHPRLVALDSQSWSYPSWQLDFKKAEQAHVEWESDCWCETRSILLMMKKKQQLHSFGRTHPDLVRLDLLKSKLSYPGWDVDFRSAEEKHFTSPDIFNDSLFKLQEKQRIYSGDRTHPRLRELDAQSWSYPEWQFDFKKAEQAHVEWESNHRSELRDVLLMMQKKQQLHCFGRTHPDLVRLDHLKYELSYPGWEADFRAAEEKHFTSPDIFMDNLFKLHEKQRMHSGDRTHPRLVELDAQSWSYPDWQVDFEKAEQAHVEWKSDHRCDLIQILVMMKKKQRIFDGFWSYTTRRTSRFEISRPQERQVMSRYPDRRQLVESRLGNSVSSEPSQPESPPGSKALTGTCIICMVASKSHAFVPCGHLCVCEACAAESFKRSRLCPMCRNSSVVVTQIFFS